MFKIFIIPPYRLCIYALSRKFSKGRRDSRVRARVLCGSWSWNVSCEFNKFSSVHPFFLFLVIPSKMRMEMQRKNGLGKKRSTSRWWRVFYTGECFSFNIFIHIFAISFYYRLLTRPLDSFVTMCLNPCMIDFVCIRILNENVDRWVYLFFDRSIYDIFRIMIFFYF